MPVVHYRRIVDQSLLIGVYGGKRSLVLEWLLIGMVGGFGGEAQ